MNAQQPGPTAPVSDKGKKLAKGAIVACLLLFIIACVAYATRSEMVEMDKRTCRVRTATTVLGIRWTGTPRDTRATPLLESSPPGTEDWVEISGISWGARVDTRWGTIASSLLNAVEWMEVESVPIPDRRRAVAGMLQIARRDNALNTGYQEDRIVISDARGGLLLECVRPAR